MNGSNIKRAGLLISLVAILALLTMLMDPNVPQIAELVMLLVAAGGIALYAMYPNGGDE